MALLDRLATVLLKEFTTEQQLASLINYLVQVGETTNAKTVVRTLAQRVPQHGGTLMTVAQQLEQAGIDIGIGKGIEQGIEQGIDIGKQTALRNVAKAMLDSGFELEVVMTITGLTADQIKSLC